jgi:hypothetical protein
LGSSWHDHGTAMNVDDAEPVMMRVIQQRAGKLSLKKKGFCNWQSEREFTG